MSAAARRPAAAPSPALLRPASLGLCRAPSPASRASRPTARWSIWSRTPATSSPAACTTARARSASASIPGRRTLPLDERFFRARLDAAVRLRESVLGLGGPGRACRLVFSEGDGLSGLTVDRYDRWLVVQFTSPRPGAATARCSPNSRRSAFSREGILPAHGARHRPARRAGAAGRPAVGRAADGADRDRGRRPALPGQPGRGAEDRLLPRPARQSPGGGPAGRGRRVLDAFCYTGGFGLHAARAGATAVLGVDVSEPALTLARANAELNGLTTCRLCADVFDQLDALVEGGERFGLVVLDPPKFARARNAVEEALRGYRRLQSQALRLLEPDGILVVCCCSGLIDMAMLEDLLAQLAAEDRRDIQILERRGQAADHPVAVTCPESNYLKCLICRVV